MKQMISDENQQYQYLVTVEDYKEYKRIKVETKFQGAKFPDAVQSKVEMFLNKTEYERFKEVLNKN
jgi:predicted transcriptional regulator